MATFIAEDVLRDYSAGMVVVTADTKEEAINLLIGQFDEHYLGAIIANLKEVENSKIYFVHGGQ